MIDTKKCDLRVVKTTSVGGSRTSETILSCWVSPTFLRKLIGTCHVNVIGRDVPVRCVLDIFDIGTLVVPVPNLCARTFSVSVEVSGNGCDPAYAVNSAVLCCVDFNYALDMLVGYLADPRTSGRGHTIDELFSVKYIIGQNLPLVLGHLELLGGHCE